MMKKIWRYIRFDRVHERDRQTDTQTDGIGRACTASRGKKNMTRKNNTCRGYVGAPEIAELISDDRNRIQMWPDVVHEIEARERGSSVTFFMSTVAKMIVCHRVS